jgi:hypothetical protein
MELDDEEAQLKVIKDMKKYGLAILKPKTNADRIRSMTDEELATVIAWPYLASPPWCAEHKTCPYISEDPTPCDKCALDWLEQEVK